MFFWRRKKKQDEANAEVTPAPETTAEAADGTLPPVAVEPDEPPVIGDSEAVMAAPDPLQEQPAAGSDEPTQGVVDVVAEPVEPLAPEGDPDEPDETVVRKSLFRKFVDRIRSTRNAIVQGVVGVFRRHGKIDEELLEDIEEVLITGDVGVDTTLALIEDLRMAVKRQKKTGSTDIDWLIGTLKNSVRERLECGSRDLLWAADGPTVILVVGVNGTGKTTAAGKMGHRFRQAGQRVLLVAADTFRAAAIDQLAIWAERAGVDIVRGAEGADPSSVCYKAVEQIKQRDYDVVIIDTAGRLHTKFNLMQELEKMGRVLSRELPGAPHEVLIVLDASTGQNALQQAKTFMGAVNVNGIILTKLDGTAKGGVTIAVHDQLHIPVKLVGVGEGLDDLENFDPDAFTDALFEGATQT